MIFRILSVCLFAPLVLAAWPIFFVFELCRRLLEICERVPKQGG